VGRQENRAEQVEALVRALLEPLGRRRRREVLESIGGKARYAEQLTRRGL
jgi:hypothetical protein